jgi:aspartyl-tRNA(Asn)/glutamyl-tRNA(Gln) amidotransferase subunit A
VVEATIVRLGERFRSGDLSVVEGVEFFLGRIRDRDQSLHAWVEIDEASVREHAEQLGIELRGGRDRGPLHGIAAGVKDIMDVRGLRTRAGFDGWAERDPAQGDAAIVRKLREAGAVILGKTATTCFAWVDPARTVNPWDASRTPGGSSSGSAVAVAAGMCPVAFGSQTGGSIVRPAAYCGVVGFKPSHGRLPLEGVLPLAPRLDHAGYMTGTVSDAIAVWEGMMGEGVLSAEGGAVLDMIEVVDPLIDQTQAVVRAALQRVIDKLGDRSRNRRSTGQVEEGCGEVDGKESCRCEPRMFRTVVGDGGLEEWNRWHRTIMAYEAAATHRELFARQGELYPPRIRSLVEEGMRIRDMEYERALGVQERMRDPLEGWGSPDCVLVMPATLDVAPGRETTGSPAWNSPWSFTGQPAITMPMGRSREGLPIGIQLVGRRGQDRELLRHAAWVESWIGGLAETVVAG